MLVYFKMTNRIKIN